MSWNNLPRWDENSSLYFNYGLIVAIVFSLAVINHTSEHSIPYSEWVDTFETGNLKLNVLQAHSDFSEKINFTKSKPQAIPLAEVVPEIIPAYYAQTANEIPVTTNNAETMVTTDVISTEKPTSGISASAEKPEPVKIFNMAENMPHLVECADEPDEYSKRNCTQQAILRIIYQYLRYPKIAIIAGVQGTVVVSFIIDKTGHITDICILKDIGYSCGDSTAKAL